MGTRINYEIGAMPSAILFSNSHHDTENPEQVFRAAVARHGHCQTDLVRELLNCFYRSSSGRHRPGDYMFSVDMEPGDREKILRVLYETEGPCIVECSDAMSV
jgi:hypothetical protein